MKTTCESGSIFSRILKEIVNDFLEWMEYILASHFKLGLNFKFTFLPELL